MVDKNENEPRRIQSGSRPTSILRVSGSYRSNHLTNNPSISINLPSETATNDTGNDASDAQAQQQRRLRREEFEQLRRDHYHNMYSIISQHRQSSSSLARGSERSDTTNSSNEEQPKK